VYHKAQQLEISPSKAVLEPTINWDTSHINGVLWMKLITILIQIVVYEK
jgi:hypothetical protein